MRIINGGLRMEARAGGRALLVIRSASGEELAIERSPEQLGDLRGQIDELLASPLPDHPAPPSPPAPEPSSPMAAKPAPKGRKGQKTHRKRA